MADALVTEAHAEERYLAAELPADVIGDAGIERGAGARRDDDVAWRQPIDLLETDGIVAIDQWLPAQLTDVLGQVVYEGVIVVNEQDHLVPPVANSGTMLKARINALALSSVSRYSASGSES